MNPVAETKKKHENSLLNIGGINWQQKIPFMAWKEAVLKNLGDVVSTVEKVDSGTKVSLTDDELRKHIVIANVLRNDKKMHDIFLQLTQNKPYMTLQ